ncbi:unnamed protein product [Closterium sp. NIES-53]
MQKMNEILVTLQHSSCAHAMQEALRYPWRVANRITVGRGVDVRLGGQRRCAVRFARARSTATARATMRVFTAEQVHRALPYDALIEHLLEAFRASSGGAGIAAPPRQHYSIGQRATDEDGDANTEVDARSGAVGDPEVRGERGGEEGEGGSGRRITAEGKKQAGGTLLVMPAWDSNCGAEEPFLGVKLATVFPGNARHGLPSVAASYLLSSAATGAPLALMDGTAITLRRTAAASALAAHYLARRDSKVLLMVGTGNLAPHLILAHLSATPSLRSVLLWGRTLTKAQQTAEHLVSSNPRFRLIESEGNSLTDLLEGQETGGVCVQVVSDLEPAVRLADVVSCATLATEPLVCGRWLKRGAHVDLVGGFRPDMREADNDVMIAARGSIFVDAKDGDAITGSGDLIKPISSGAILEKDIGGDLCDLCSERVHGRRASEDITVFKSVEEKKVDAVEKSSEETTNSLEEKSSTDVKPSANADSEPATDDKEKKDDETTPDSDVVEVEAEKVPEVAASADAVPSTTETTAAISTKRKAEASEDETGAKKVCLEAEA